MTAEYKCGICIILLKVHTSKFGKCYSYSVLVKGANGCILLAADWWKASQAFAVLSLLVLAGAAVVSLLTLCCKDWGRKIILILQAVAFFGAGE